MIHFCHYYSTSAQKLKVILFACKMAGVKNDDISNKKMANCFQVLRHAYGENH